MRKQQIAFEFSAVPAGVPGKIRWSAANGNSPAFIDLFAGVGGFHYGFAEAGATCVAAAEINGPARKTYQHVHGETSPDLFRDGAARFFRDVSQMAVADNDNVPPFDIIAAGFPCQAFSVAGKKQGFGDDKGRGILFFELARLLYRRRPIAFMFENVRGLLGHDGGRTWGVILKIVEDLGYRMVHQVVRGTDYGIPQLRPRVFMVGVRQDALPATISDDAMKVALFPHLSRKYPLLFTFDSVVGGITGRVASRTIRCSGMQKRVGSYANWSAYKVTIDGVEQTVVLNVDQCIRLMGLPTDFSFPEGTTKTHRRAQLGNGVIVPVVAELAKALVAFVERNVLPGTRPTLQREPSDDGHMLIVNNVLVENGLSPFDPSPDQNQKEQKMSVAQKPVGGRTPSNTSKPAVNDNAAKACGRIAAYGEGKSPKPRKRKAAGAAKSKTGIAWATETVNPFKGCSKVSPECKHCYAVGWATRHQALGSRGYAGTVKNKTFTGTIGVVPEVIDELRSAKSDRVFVNSMSDTFHANVSDADVTALFDAMTANPSKSQFLVCTKRADRMAAFSQAYAVPDKVWCGVTVGCRNSLHRLDDLRRVKAKIRWVSVEPLLEEIDIEPWLADGTVNWVVVGGESGPNHRPMDKAWAEKIAREHMDEGVFRILVDVVSRMQGQGGKFRPGFP
ncbi:DUF5131 family protein [Magnetospirillum moscoviense]|uniref:Cytosine-specific methyltransferase n=1 Tax=Magnetospirillum moscoviense TaxID=1437059 RepID=A0A178N2J1_9PROT|nr:DUF5131 family protein [Magnetospirillum moscoviense]OAN67320.1 hypothetical protein A6A05_18305 [Magnetospirillum moscoviense]